MVGWSCYGQASPRGLCVLVQRFSMRSLRATAVLSTNRRGGAEQGLASHLPLQRMLC